MNKYVLVSSIFLWTLTLWAQDHLKKQPKMIYELFKENHYAPKAVDNAFSKDLFEATLADIDEQGPLFTSQDILHLGRFQTLLDEEFIVGQWAFLDALSVVYRKRVNAAIKVLDGLNLSTPKYAQGDSVYRHLGKSSYLKDEAAFAEAWSRKVKYLTLWLIIEENRDKVLAKDFDFAAQEALLRKRVIKRQKRKLERLIASDMKVYETLSASYFSAFVHLFDPHSNYFSKESWAEFFTALSSDEYVFGFTVGESATGELEIVNIIPGGAAWRSNELHKKDVIKTLSYKGHKVHLEEVSEEEFEALIAKPDISQIDIEVQKTDGSTKKVSLVKEKSQNERNIIKSYVINSQPKIGYIALPGFYIDTDNSHMLGCANDVAKELLKLKAEGIKGLVFDIRYNGGGAMHEAQDLSGLFLNEGPLFSVKDAQQTPKIMKDLNRGILFDGPMVVLVNRQSASASEIFASTLQDYNRAVIVGSTTYGKATGQSLFPLGVDTSSSQQDISVTGLGGVSITRLKLYRVTGKSNQIIGVKPDIDMPDLYNKMDYGEGTYSNALQNDETSKKPLFKSLPPLPLDKLKKNSEDRQNTKVYFTKLNALIYNMPALLTQKDEVALPLTLKGLYPFVRDYKVWAETLDRLNKDNEKEYTVVATKAESQIAKLDTTYNEVQKEITEDLEKDAFIQESCKIVLDLIKFTAK